MRTAYAVLMVANDVEIATFLVPVATANSQEIGLSYSMWQEICMTIRPSHWTV